MTAVEVGNKQMVSFEEPLMSQVVQQEALTRFLVEKGNIHQRGAFGDGEGGGSGDEEKKNRLIQNHISLEVTNER